MLYMLGKSTVLKVGMVWKVIIAVEVAGLKEAGTDA